MTIECDHDAAARTGRDLRIDRDVGGPAAVHTHRARPRNALVLRDREVDVPVVRKGGVDVPRLIDRGPGEFVVVAASHSAVPDQMVRPGGGEIVGHRDEDLVPFLGPAVIDVAFAVGAGGEQRHVGSGPAVGDHVAQLAGKRGIEPQPHYRGRRDHRSSHAGVVEAGALEEVARLGRALPVGEIANVRAVGGVPLPVIDRRDVRDRSEEEVVATVERHRAGEVGERQTGHVDVVVAEHVALGRGLQLGVSAAQAGVRSAVERVGLPARVVGAPQARARGHAGDRRDVELAVAVEFDRRLAVEVVIEYRRRAGRRVGAEMLVAAPLIGADRVLPDPRRRGSRRAQGDGREVALVHRLEYADADPVGHGSVDHAPGRDLRIRAGRCGRLRRGTCDRIEDVDVEIVDRGVRPLHLDRDDVVGMEGRIAGGNREREQVVVTGVRDRRAVGPVGPRNVVGGVGAGERAAGERE